MAIVSYKLLSLLPLLLASLAVLSRAMITPNGKTKTTSSLFDVQASIRKTLDVFSPGSREVEDSLKDDDHRSHSSSSSSERSYSFTLRPRLSVRPTRARDYKSLMAARLARDSARMKSLRARLDPAVETDADQDAPVTFSSNSGVGEYFVSLGIGDPPQQINMIMDTGSDVCWVSKTVFDPSKLPTYHELACNAPLCQSCNNNNKCTFNLKYGDGSTASGVLAPEKVTFSGGSSVDGIVIGSADVAWGMWAGAGALVGLSRGAVSLSSQMNASSFSYCLVDQDSKSKSTLDFNSDAPAGSVFAPLLSNPPTPNFYYVGLAGISVGGGGVISALPGSGGQAIVDSGTAMTRFPRDLYTAVENEFIRLMGNTSRWSVPPFNTCFDLKDNKSANVTTLSFHFSNDNVLTLPPENILVPVDSSGTFCFAFAVAASTTIIGNLQQQGMRVSFDLDNNDIGFAPGQC
ncbi:unnamed protein product [Cuscuta epithymum]|uniref:Peptidase A1 domain-containing protein n=1 Tax=Cuscuta epithymum TaxID=186058 RepID=A0AAV0CP51_9ASTE|nr:unnamed protein product [Cuscuta epithymum]